MYIYCNCLDGFTYIRTYLIYSIIQMYTCTNVCTVCLCLYVPTYIGFLLHMYIHMYVNVYIFMYVHMYVCIYGHMYVRTYIRIVCIYVQGNV